MLVDFVYADGEQGEYPMCASVLIVVFLTYVLITFPSSLRLRRSFLPIHLSHYFPVL
jgi:hypothetical protein